MPRYCRDFRTRLRASHMDERPRSIAGQQCFSRSFADTFSGRYNLPALAAAVVKNGSIVASGAVGTRRAGTDNPVTVNDRFHIGSDTKAMTALIAAMLVEGGKIQWTSTISEVFPELAVRWTQRFEMLRWSSCSPTLVESQATRKSRQNHPAVVRPREAQP